MTFNARYMHRRGEFAEYWRTIHADSLADAMREAEKYARKGFLMVGVFMKEDELA